MVLTKKKKLFVLLLFLLCTIFCNAVFAGKMKISLQGKDGIIDFYDGDIIFEIDSKISKAQRIDVGGMFLCPQAEEGYYCLTVQGEDGKIYSYVVSDDFQVYGKGEGGETIILSCKILNELRGVLIQYLLSNKKCGQ